MLAIASKRPVHFEVVVIFNERLSAAEREVNGSRLFVVVRQRDTFTGIHSRQDLLIPGRLLFAQAVSVKWPW
jgi:hypothetical protein